VPVRQSYYGICHVDVEEDVRGVSGFIPVEQYGGYTETMPFEFGAVGGVRWCSTEIIPVSSNCHRRDDFRRLASSAWSGVNGGFDVYSSYIYGQEAVGTVGLGNEFAATSAEMYDPKNPPGVFRSITRRVERHFRSVQRNGVSGLEGLVRGQDSERELDRQGP
jgi:N4-gp56 family major capsid protein